MNLDSSLVDYMKERAELAKLIACAMSVQCFVLAVFFCAYGLCYNHFALSKSMAAFRMGIIIASVVFSICLAVFNVFICIRYRKICQHKPDYIALRQSEDVTEEAFMIARPVLIFKITLALFITFMSGLAYILLVILMDRAEMAGIYGRIIVCLALAAVFVIGFPAFDRIYAYRCVLRQLPGFLNDNGRYYLGLGIAVLTPLSICGWYIMRFFTGKCDIAWIVFPMTALFGTAVVYLINWLSDEKVIRPVENMDEE